MKRKSVLRMSMVAVPVMIVCALLVAASSTRVDQERGATAGIMLHRELELEVEAGIPPAKALQIATFNAARLLKQEQDLGSIAPGKRADLVLVEGNPAEHISDIRRCRLVMKNGVLYKSADLYSAAGIKPAD